MSDLYRHGGPYDRGRADSYYQRGYRPHYFKGDTYHSEEVGKDQMTLMECIEYTRGYQENQTEGNFKDWG